MTLWEPPACRDCCYTPMREPGNKDTLGGGGKPFSIAKSSVLTQSNAKHYYFMLYMIYDISLYITIWYIAINQNVRSKEGALLHRFVRCPQAVLGGVSKARKGRPLKTWR